MQIGMFVEGVWTGLGYAIQILDSNKVLVEKNTKVEGCRIGWCEKTIFTFYKGEH